MFLPPSRNLSDLTEPRRIKILELPIRKSPRSPFHPATPKLPTQDALLSIFHISILVIFCLKI